MFYLKINKSYKNKMKKQIQQTPPKCAHSESGYSCDWPAYWNPRTGRYSKYCSRLCQRNQCIHNDSAMSVNAMYSSFEDRQENCTCEGCDKLQFYDSRILAHRSHCSKECRDKTCDH